MNSFKFFQKFKPYPSGSIQWRTGQGTIIPIDQLSNSHIRNILTCLTGTGERTIPDPYQDKTHNEWYLILLNELRSRTTNPYVEEVREYITDMFRDAQTHEFCAGVHNTQLILHYEGDMDIESVRAMTWDLTNRYTNYVSINEHVIGFMENYLNEHLSGTSTIRLA
jgi:hypothetical protein